MKNIHIISTDKPSRLWTNNLKRRLELDEFPSQHPTNIAKNIYITSDEEIKEGDSYMRIDTGLLFKSLKGSNPNIIEKYCKKIILTTDQDLIKDGVQAIDDDFLEWFVKNSSCEKVEVCYQLHKDEPLYKIIIPKEEPKQENCCTPKGQIKRYVDCVGCDRKPKQEKLEETALNIIPNKSTAGWIDTFGAYERTGFIKGAKYQAERMYSEEEVKQIINKTLIEYSDYVLADVLEWFEQFKKK